MKISIFVEGCYPYVVGGVSSWVQMLVSELKEFEFIIQTVAATREVKGQFKYELPPNVTQVHEMFLMDDDIVKKKKYKYPMNREMKDALRSLIFGENTDWITIFHYFHENRDVSVNQLLMGKEFFEIAFEYHSQYYPSVIFTDFLWTLRSIYSPLCTLMKNQLLDADVFHTIATGYSGLLASMAKEIHRKPLLMSEHGIYTREREEEIIKAEWTKGIYKNLWIRFFYQLSHCAYGYSNQVISLFEASRTIQTDIGCPTEKTLVIPNGIDIHKYDHIQHKDPEESRILLGSVLRVTPIKDVKTLINAFAVAKEQNNNLVLYIMGPTDEDPEYYDECIALVNSLKVEDIIFTGRINVLEYIGKMDVILLSSVSEGQPLSILEAFAAGRPCIATNVGNCEGLIYGERDHYGRAGIIVPVMDVTSLAQSILILAGNQQMREEMGAIGYKRVKDFYTGAEFIKSYRSIYLNSKNLRM